MLVTLKFCKVSFSDPLIDVWNIDRDAFAFRKLGNKFLEYLRKDDSNSYELFNHRSAQYVDIVILLDWNTTQEILPNSTYLNTLKDILENWDPGTKYKKIKLLNGGYQEWLTTYPAFTTNPNVAVPEFNDVANEILETIEYPEWLHSDEEDEVLKKAQNKSNNETTSNKDMDMDHGDNKSTTSKHTRSNSNDVSPAKIKNFTSHMTISIDGKQPSRGDGVNAQRFEDASISQHKIPSNKVSQSEINAKPVIDRSSKPAALKTYDPRCKEILKFMKELNELAKSKAKLAEELYNQEYELYSQRDDKRSASDEKYIRTEIKSLKGKLDEMVFIFIT